MNRRGLPRLVALLLLAAWTGCAPRALPHNDKVEGTVTLPEGRLTIGPNAHVRADIHSREVVIFGQLTGNVQATGRVELRQSANVKGDILAGRLSIEESAVLTGRVELKPATDAPKASTPAVTVPVPAEATTPLFSQPKA